MKTSTDAFPADELAPALPPTPRQLAPADMQAFLLMEAALLDERRFEEWLSLYTADCIYWMPAEPDQTDADKRISLFYDQRSTLEDRIWRLRHPKMFSQNPPVRQTRLVSNIVIGDGGSDQSPVLLSCFIMFENRLKEERVFGGRIEHVLRRAGDQWRIAKKTVRLANCDAFLWNIGVPI